MSDLIVIGTDTGAGKTSLALRWIASFHAEYEYWKPVESGASDSELIRSVVPPARLHPPIARYTDAVAPALAARRANTPPPTAAEIVHARPDASADCHLLIETFGSALS